MLLKGGFFEKPCSIAEQKDKLKEAHISTNNVGQPWNITEEKDDHNPDENGSQVNLFLHRSSGSFVRQSGENETADQDPRGR